MGRKLGQHFLKNTGKIEAIASLLSPCPGETLIEIGAGHGELTAALLRRSPKTFCLLAVEKDPSLAAGLRRKFSGDSRLQVVSGDIRDLLPNLVKNLKTDAYKIVGNIPYYLTGRLLRLLGELHRPPGLAVFLVQKEVAERVCSRSPRANLLSLSVQFWAEPRQGITVRASDFSPPPRVTSAVLLLRPLPAVPAAKAYYETLHLLFRHPRKTIFNNLRSAGCPEPLIKEVLARLEINLQARPQVLTPSMVAAMAGHILVKKALGDIMQPIKVKTNYNK